MTAPCYGCPEDFRESLTTSMVIFPKIFELAFVPIDPMSVRTKFEVRSFTRFWDNEGTPKNWGRQSLDKPTLLFSKIVMGFCLYVRLDPVNVPTKFEVRSFSRYWDNSDWSFEWGWRTSDLGKGGVAGREWYCPKERWWVPVGLT